MFTCNSVTFSYQSSVCLQAAALRTDAQRAKQEEHVDINTLRPPAEFYSSETVEVLSKCP